MESTRVPRTDSGFDKYIRASKAALEAGTPTTAVRLGVTPTQLAAWIAFFDDWVLYYGKYSDPAQRTTAIKDSKNEVKADFIVFAEPVLKVMETSSALTNDDRITFRIPKRKTTRTKRGPINDSPFGKLKTEGLGLMRVQVRREHDASRPSMHKLADAVEFKFKIVERDTPVPPIPGPTPPPSSDSDLPLPKDMPNSHVSKRSTWRMELGEENVNKRIIGYVRWVNLTDPANNSGWSDLLTTIIT